jgi:hypothetical protein
VKGQAYLLEVVGAADAVGGFPHLLNGRQQQAEQDDDDGDDDEQLDQRKSGSMARWVEHVPAPSRLR